MADPEPIEETPTPVESTILTNQDEIINKLNKMEKQTEAQTG